MMLAMMRRGGGFVVETDGCDEDTVQEGADLHVVILAIELVSDVLVNVLRRRRNAAAVGSRRRRWMTAATAMRRQWQRRDDNGAL